VEGCGKSTQARLLAQYIATFGYLIVQTREPGGTFISEQIRDILLKTQNIGMMDTTELLLYLASRSQHVNELILPALSAGKAVICERFSDASFAYQGYARGFNLDELDYINRIATGGLEPDLTLILDLEVREGISRKHKDNLKLDRLENESIEFHNKVRNGYLEIARNFPHRVKVIDASGSIQEVQLQIKDHLDGWLADRQLRVLSDRG
jgi:dTMP kinase